ncbi:MAG: hypothetical protein A2648_00740 [Candidatus Lloydbacteria bacterium RIFCSPHIGHO2_01_FULL_41_20]|uniref:Glycine zipper domain-containing protein n=1 Tax=Candidatus Lloydbacteria bacterium RIFCSPHIGHO2_01_FULL_41_20 TaxID=1798657 RepID=A0A1G2CTR3_9BACT|nr:MAG: hypothetical protein A2648_00740 [Candidatus Lloydbacteria bacterium RIFCSPHIGHO2_01_FULL_41_20]
MKSIKLMVAVLVSVFALGGCANNPVGSGLLGAGAANLISKDASPTTRVWATLAGFVIGVAATPVSAQPRGAAMACDQAPDGTLSNCTPVAGAGQVQQVVVPQYTSYPAPAYFSGTYVWDYRETDRRMRQHRQCVELYGGAC